MELEENEEANISKHREIGENYDPESDNPQGEDVYDMNLVDDAIDPDEIHMLKQKLDALDVSGDQALYARMMGGDLDVPGSELDDANESIGDEDEENNYYSLDDQDNDQ